MSWRHTSWRHVMHDVCRHDVTHHDVTTRHHAKKCHDKKCHDITTSWRHILYFFGHDIMASRHDVTSRRHVTKSQHIMTQKNLQGHNTSWRKKNVMTKHFMTTHVMTSRHDDTRHVMTRHKAKKSVMTSHVTRHNVQHIMTQKKCHHFRILFSVLVNSSNNLDIGDWCLRARLIMHANIMHADACWSNDLINIFQNVLRLT